MVKKQTGNTLASLGSRAMRGEKMKPKEIRSLGASVVSQDETKGKRPKK